MEFLEEGGEGDDEEGEGEGLEEAGRRGGWGSAPVI